MPEQKRILATRSECRTVENPPGVFRTTMTFNRETMLCHFTLKAGSLIPLHDHPAVQHGYVVRGRVRFRRGEEGEFLAEAGTSYVFGPNEKHGAQALEETEVVEVFAPMRPEYVEG